MTERIVARLCEMIAKACGGDVERYRRTVAAMKQLPPEQQLEQVERHLRFLRRRESATKIPPGAAGQE